MVNGCNCAKLPWRRSFAAVGRLMQELPLPHYELSTSATSNQSQMRSRHLSLLSLRLQLAVCLSRHSDSPCWSLSALRRTAAREPLSHVEPPPPLRAEPPQLKPAASLSSSARGCAESPLTERLRFHLSEPPLPGHSPRLASPGPSTADSSGPRVTRPRWVEPPGCLREPPLPTPSDSFGVSHPALRPSLMWPTSVGSPRAHVNLWVSATTAPRPRLRSCMLT